MGLLLCVTLVRGPYENLKSNPRVTEPSDLWKEDEMTIELTEPERDLILELLERQSKDLMVEIRHSDTRDFREELQHREQLVESLLERFKRSEAHAVV